MDVFDFNSNGGDDIDYRYVSFFVHSLHLQWLMMGKLFRPTFLSDIDTISNLKRYEDIFA